MWELLLNGLSIAGSGASMWSLASGFSLEREIKSHQRAIQKLSEAYYRLEGSLDRIGQEPTLNELNQHLASLTQADSPFVQRANVLSLEREMRRMNSELEQVLKPSVLEVTAAVREILSTYKLNRAPAIQLPGRAIQILQNDPFEFGVNQVWDVTESGLFAAHKHRIVTAHSTPISWIHQSGRRFLGEVPTSRLQQLGLNVAPPHYAYETNGHIYSDKHGLFLPSYMVR